MAVERAHFRDAFSVFPQWNCPTCATGTLKEVPKARSVVEPTYSKNLRREDWWEPDHTIGRFVALLQCTHSSCGETVYITGNHAVESYGYDEEGEHWGDLFQPRATYPSVAVFRLKEEWPEAVAAQLRRSFTHIWSDPGAAANSLRTAVECLMDQLNVKKYPRTGPRHKINLHLRIVDFALQNPEAAEFLLAVKWLGNTGSHSDITGLNRSDVLDAMELLERALHLVYDEAPKRLARLAKSINKKKGPIVKPKKA